MVLREKGLISLGLCCLIARVSFSPPTCFQNDSYVLQRMALNSFQLFLNQIQTSPEILKLRVLQVVFDMLMVHEPDFLAKGSENVCYFHSSWLAVLILFLFSDRAFDRLFVTCAR
jgi:condensin complex subunit 3